MRFELDNNVSGGYMTISDESLDPDIDTGVKAFCPLCNRRLRYDSAASVYRCLDCLYVYQYDKTTGIKKNDDDNNNKNSGIRPLTDSGLTGEKLLIDSVGREPRGLLGATQDPGEAMAAMRSEQQQTPQDKWLESLGASSYKETTIIGQSRNVISPEQLQQERAMRQKQKLRSVADKIFMAERERRKEGRAQI